MELIQEIATVIATVALRCRRAGHARAVSIARAAQWLARRDIPG